MAALTPRAHTLHAVRHREEAAAARAAVRAAMRSEGAREDDIERAERCANELFGDLLEHATAGGFALVAPIAGRGVELIALDRGPGVPDVAHVLRRPSVARARALADELDAVSKLGRGTGLLARCTFAPREALGAFSIGGVCVAMPGAGVCGDRWAVRVDGGALTLMVVDGVGHGPAAAEAADAAISVLGPRELDALLDAAHVALRPTRGAVLSLTRIENDRLTHASIGNVEGRLIAGGKSRALLASPGTLGPGLARPKCRVEAYEWAPGAALALCTDGVKRDPASWSELSMACRDPALAAAVHFRDAGRERDDATVVIVQDAR